MLITITGKSGTGKTTLETYLSEVLETYTSAVSHTTRPKRDAEVDGVDYYFRNTLEGVKTVEQATYGGNEYALSYGEAQGDKIAVVTKEGLSQLEEVMDGSVYRILVTAGPFKTFMRLVRRDGIKNAIKRVCTDTQINNTDGQKYDLVLDNTKDGLDKHKLNVLIFGINKEAIRC